LEDGEMISVDCRVCTPFVIYGPSFVNPMLEALPKVKRAALSHWIRLAYKPNEPPALAKTVLEQLLPQLALPPVGEQANSLVRDLGDYLAEHGPAEKLQIALANWAAIIGATDDDGAWYIVEELLKSGVLNGNVAKNFNEIGLTFRGWSLYDELRLAHSEGPIAFMAMQFGNALMERVYRDCFRPACKQTGFDLRTIIENPPAGVIDNRLRVEIRKARFMVADLTLIRN